MQTQRKMNRKQLAILIAIAAVALLAVIYVAVSFYFNKHFPFRTTINGIDCSGKSIGQVKSLISEAIEPYQLELEVRNGQTEIIKGAEIDLHSVFDDNLQNELKSRSGFTWPASLFRKTNIELETMVSYDEAKLQNVINTLQCIKQSDKQKPVSAHLSDYTKGKGYEIIPEEEGAQLNEKIFLEVIHKSIINLQNRVSLEEANCYVAPETRADDESLLTAVSQLNAYVLAVITYEFGDTKEILDGSTIHNWMGLTDTNQAAIDEAQAAAYVKELAAKHDTYGGTRNFTTSYGQTVQLTNNKYGWQIDQSAETARLIEDIKTGSAISREPIFSKRGVSFGTKDYGNTYVEINLTAQHLIMYKKGSVLLETDFISGDPSTGHATPPGAFAVTYTEKDRILRGSDYAAHVDFWMPFNGNIGMHDAIWKFDFGGNYYTYTGSHGCINLPYYNAETIFKNLKKGDPVFVYKLPGTESDKYWKQEKAENLILKIDDTVTLNSKSAIDAAWAACNELSEYERQYLRNYDKLVAAKAAYEKLNSDQQAEKDKAAAQTVINAINAIGEVTADSRSAIENARSQYNALTETAKQYVTNLNILLEAEATLKEM